MTLKRNNWLATLGLFSYLIGTAQNPIIKDIGMSDPHARVFGDKIYLYTGHDDDPNDRSWVMKEWRVFSSTDLTDWKLESTISPRDNYMKDDSKDCWAADAATRNGKYYFYFSDRNRSVGVMTSDSPTGPFKDPLGEPLVSPRHDPTVVTDDDANKTPYLIYGDKDFSYRIARLNDDMISLAETPRPIEINGEEWDRAPGWMDKNYLFKHKDTWYLSWGRDYATSKNIYGPYKTQGRVGNGYGLSAFAHGSFFWWKGQFYHVWCYYLRSGFRYRESVISYCHFDDNGNIVTDTDYLDQHFSTGVGRYDAAWPRIEAEWFYEKSTGRLDKQECSEGGFQLAYIQNDTWLQFAKTKFTGKETEFTVRVSSENSGNRIEVHTGSPDGPVISEIEVPDTGGFDTYQTFSAPISTKAREQDIYLKFKGNSTYLFNINWLRFEGNTPNQQTVHMSKRNAEGFAIDGNNGVRSGQSVYLWTSKISNVNQQWIEINRGDGYVSYQKKGTNHCMDGGNGGKKGQDVVLQPCDAANENQHWKKVSASGGSFRLLKRNAPGFALDGGNGGEKGQNVYLWTASASNQNQQWNFTVLNSPGNKVEPAKESTTQFSVYPNPVQHTLKIEGISEESGILTIYSAVGTKIKTVLISRGDAAVDVSALPAGLYFIKPDGSHNAQRFIKSRLP